MSLWTCEPAGSITTPFSCALHRFSFPCKTNYSGGVLKSGQIVTACVCRLFGVTCQDVYVKLVTQIKAWQIQESCFNAGEQCSYEVRHMTFHLRDSCFTCLSDITYF